MVLMDDITLHAPAIVQPDSFGDRRDYLDLFANGVNERELRFREEDGEGNAGESASRADIEHLRFGAETDDARDAEAVEDVVKIEVVDVFPADDIDFFVPLAVERFQRLQLFDLERCQTREELLDEICTHRKRERGMMMGTDEELTGEGRWGAAAQGLSPRRLARHPSVGASPPSSPPPLCALVGCAVRRAGMGRLRCLRLPPALYTPFLRGGGGIIG